MLWNLLGYQNSELHEKNHMKLSGLLSTETVILCNKIKETLCLLSIETVILKKINFRIGLIEAVEQ